MGRGRTRREFFETSLKAGAAASLGLAGGADAVAALAGDLRDRAPGTQGLQGSGRRRRALRILILGGTGVTGPHLVARALERGHAVSVFNRGRTEPLVHADLFGQVEELVGDRAGDLSALEGGSWDAVIDNSGSSVDWTVASAELLRDRAEHYLYTSSTGAYYPYLGYDIDEETELLLDVPSGAPADQRGVYEYGVMKANSENAARRIFGDDRAIVLRPTYIMGPGDRTDRFTYWPVRIARGGEVLVPGAADDPVQFIDSRDFAAFAIHLLETGTAGTFNVAGPAAPMGMHAFVHGVHAAFNSAVEWVYADDQPFLMERGVTYAVPWIMPYGNNWGSARVDNTRAISTGLTFRPLARSVRDIHDWWMSDAVDDARRERMAQGMMAAEADVIAAWKALE